MSLPCSFRIVLILAICITSQSAAQLNSTVEISDDEFAAFLKRLQTMDCIEDAPAPMLFAEPRYTRGTSNSICFQLPDTSALPFSPDTIRVPYVVTHVVNEVSGEVLEYPRPVVLTDDSVQFETIPSLLENGIRYNYTVQLVLPICDATCEDIVEQHCSAFQDTVWSIQDSTPPSVENVTIPELAESPVAGWTNQSALSIEADIADPAGVWQAFLFRRECDATSWQESVADSTFNGAESESGFIFAESVQATFDQNLADGCYELRVEGKDATHTPESCFPDFELAGNGGQPLDTDSPQLTLNVDSTPPDSVTLDCAQSSNRIHLNWTAASDPAPGIGLAGYHIVRDGERLATVPANRNSFSDEIPITAPETEFEYRVQPFDSLQNVQTAGGAAVCIYKPVSQISMLPEPEFTAGDTNLVCWTGSPTIDTFTAHRARACDFQAAESVTVDDTCFTFTELQDGVSYCYWVTAVDRQGRTVVSDTVSSIQDATFPQIIEFEIAEHEVLADGNWVNMRDVQLRLIAGDRTPGQLETILISEDGEPRDPIPVDASDEIDLAIPYTLAADECSPITLTTQVVDAAGNRSTQVSFTFKLDATPPSPVTVLDCGQLTAENGMRLQWSESSEPTTCSGLQGFRILRDDVEIATVSANTTSYEDLLPVDTPDATFNYHVQPVDSLENVQVEGGEAMCEYESASFITIEKMDEFSPGLSNEVCWEVSGDLNLIKAFIDANGDFTADDSVVFNMPQSQMCHTFSNLTDGQKYAYWIIGLDAQQRIAASDTVASIQDDTPPRILNFEFSEGETVNNQQWTYSRDINLDVMAQDAFPGELWNYVLVENTRRRFEDTFRDSVSNFGGKLRYQISASTEQSTRINLSLRVLDGAGNQSAAETLTLYLQEDAPRLFAFPNPFNPKNQSTTIRVREIEETEIKIYDFFGNHVQTLNRKENDHDFIWDGRNGRGEMVANGGYVCVGTETGARFKIAVVKK